jgi:Ca2+-binding RTX toxin-like protein
VAKPATTDRGSCTFSEALQITCLLGTLNPGDTVTISQTVTPTAPGRIGGAASVSGAVEEETNLTNNDASAWVDVVAAGHAGIDCTITAKPGQHELTGTPGDDVICGTPGDDVITGRGGDDLIYGFGGNDRLIGGAGNDLLCGGLGRDSLKGGAGSDGLSGGDGDDHLFGGLGNDGLYGNAGNDELVGDLGHDRLVGGIGKDTVLARDRLSDLVDGGAGRDRAVLDLNRDFFRSIEKRDVRR